MTPKNERKGTEAFIREMDGLLGYAACMEARIAPEGAGAETLTL